MEWDSFWTKERKEEQRAVKEVVNSVSAGLDEIKRSMDCTKRFFFFFAYPNRHYRRRCVLVVSVSFLALALERRRDLLRSTLYQHRMSCCLDFQNRWKISLGAILEILLSAIVVLRGLGPHCKLRW